MTRRTRRRTLAAVQWRTARLQPFGFPEFGRILSEASGVPVLIAPSTTLPRSVAGRWLRSGGGDVIEYAADLPEIARINSVLHEAGHILHEHGTDEQRLETGQALCSVISPTAISHYTRIRYRSVYDSRSEQDAETFARQTLRTILWSDVDTTESAQLCAALGFPRTRIRAALGFPGIRSD